MCYGMLRKEAGNIKLHILTGNVSHAAIKINIINNSEEDVK